MPSLVLLIHLKRQHRVRRNTVLIARIAHLRHVGHEGVVGHLVAIRIEIPVFAHAGHHFEEGREAAVRVKHILCVSSRCEMWYRFGKGRTICVIYCKTTGLDPLASSDSQLLGLVLTSSGTASLRQRRNAEFLLIVAVELSLQVDDVVIEVAGADIGVVLGQIDMLYKRRDTSRYSV